MSPRLTPPAEWTKHLGCWVAWPSDLGLWPQLAETQAAFVRMCRAIAKGEKLHVLVQDEAQRTAAGEALEDLEPHLVCVPFGDIWLRDTGPIVCRDAQGRSHAVHFRWTGWGGKFHYPGDAELAQRLSELHGFPLLASPIALEGGALEHDGEGTVLTTSECALSPQRNPDSTKKQLETVLERTIRAHKVIWLQHGLCHDHTDGHIDNVARFVAPGRVVCARPSGLDDPQADVLRQIERELNRAKDAEGRRLDVVSVPSPGRVEGRDGSLLPASHLNFYLSNCAVVVPVYGGPEEDRALRDLEQLFPGRSVQPIPSHCLLEQGGAIHCITQQIPI